jgi:hypothetical protein
MLVVMIVVCLGCKRETMAENNMALKYLQKVSLDKYLMIVRKGFYSLAVLKL